MRSSGRDARYASRQDNDDSAPRGTPRDLRWALAIMLVSGFALWRAWFLMRPLEGLAPHSRTQSEGCLTNLAEIGRGFALYASDWDGKFPRGKDAEDRAQPQMWRREPWGRGTAYAAVMAEPMLPDLLQSYGVPRTIWHCPSDVGWDTLRDANVGPQSLKNVHPSAWQKYGMSYSYLTMFGLRGLRSGDLGGKANKSVLLFDNAFWHRATESGQHQAGTLFADGSARMTSPQELERLVNDDSPLNTQ